MRSDMTSIGDTMRKRYVLYKWWPCAMCNVCRWVRWEVGADRPNTDRCHSCGRFARSNWYIDWVFESNAWVEGNDCILDWPGPTWNGRPVFGGPAAARVFLAMADGIQPPSNMDAAHFVCHNAMFMRLDHIRWETGNENAASTPTFAQLLKLANPTEVVMLHDILMRADG